MRVALSGLTMAEYFRDVEHQDVLLFIDNIFRFTQAGSEVSALLGRMPSRRRLPADPGDRDGRAAGAHHLDQEGLDHVRAGGLRACGRPDRPGAGDYVRRTWTRRSVFRRDIASMGIYPAVDPLDSVLAYPRPRMLSAREHYEVATYRSSPSFRSTRNCRTSSPSSAWTSCPSEDKLTVARARKIQHFLSQPFSVAEQFTGMPGKYVPVAETIRGFREILDGKHDDLPESAFLFAGTIDEVVEKAKKGA